LHPHGSEENEDWYGVADVGESDDEGVGGSDPVETDDLDLARHRRKTAHISVGGDLGISGLGLDIHCVKGLFLARNEDLFRTFYDEIAALILGALAGLLEEGCGLSVEDAAAGMEQNWYLKKGHALVFTCLC